MDKKKTTRSASSNGMSRGKQSSGKSQQTSKSRSGAASRNSAQTETAEAGMDEMLEKLFVDSLKDIYYAEKLLAKALPKMAKAATTEELKEAILQHQEETEVHIERLEQVFEIMGKRAQGKKCEAMDGLKKEADSIVEDTEAGTHTRDVGIIMAAQKVEHYEIATYGSLTTLARTFGMDEVAEILHQTLEEEKACDELLTSIAESGINYEAGQEEEE